MSRGQFAVYVLVKPPRSTSTSWKYIDKYWRNFMKILWVHPRVDCSLTRVRAKSFLKVEHFSEKWILDLFSLSLLLFLSCSREIGIHIREHKRFEV